jgi:hypothetical protein
MPLSLTASFLSSHPHHSIDLHRNLYSLRLQEAENALSSLVLIALLTYFYTAFGKFFAPGGTSHAEIGSDHSDNEVARRKLGSPIYYSSAAAA